MSFTNHRIFPHTFIGKTFWKLVLVISILKGHVHLGGSQCLAQACEWHPELPALPPMAGLQTLSLPSMVGLQTLVGQAHRATRGKDQEKVAGCSLSEGVGLPCQGTQQGTRSGTDGEWASNVWNLEQNGTWR